MAALTLKTLKLQEMVSKAIKGAGNNKHIPLTSLMEISLSENNRLTITTTDASNYLKVVEDKVMGDPFNVVVESDTFAKLVAKTTVDSITLNLDGEILTVTGNGKYTIELPLDEEGHLIKYPQYKMGDPKWQKQLNLSTVKVILNTNKAALAETMEVPCYTGYYFGTEAVVTTDTFKICYNAIGLFDEPLLLPAEMVTLLGLMTDEKINVEYDGQGLLFTTGNCILYGLTQDELEDFDVASITAFVNTDFESACKLPKAALLSLIDRLSLFVTPYDNNGIKFAFTKEGIIVNSKKQTGSELIKYQDSTNFKPFACVADIQLLKSQISAVTDEVIELWYGHEAALKITHGKITQIISLLDDESDGGSESQADG